jgi:hypothetical protein
VPVVVEVWKRYAGQIEADLLRQGVDIADWHRGILSSRRLMVLLKYQRDDDWFTRDAIRGGRQSRWQRVIEEIYNEQLRLRSSYEAVASQGDVRWDASEFAMRDPVDQVEHEKLKAAESEAVKEATDEFFSDLGFS